MKKVLTVIHPTVSGIEYHRQLIPHYYLNEQEGWEVHQINEIDSASDEFLKQFQLVQFSRLVSFKGEHKQVLDRLRKLGIRSVLDMDDHWILPKTHPMYFDIKKNKVTEQTVECIVNADFITTTTAHLAKEIEYLNPDVEVIQNAINPDQPQFEINCQPSGKLRFGWVGGSSHLEDIKLLSHSMQLLNTHPYLAGKYQLYLMGFNPDDQSGIYSEMERVFISGLHINSDVYYRINGANIYTYAQGYNLFDVALIPLVNNKFNNCKSELKLIEAGFMKKAAIVSDVTPYTQLLTDKNCLWVEALRNYKDWFSNMKLLIQEPNLVAEIAEQLHETVKEKYHIKTANALRMQVYERLIN